MASVGPALDPLRLVVGTLTIIRVQPPRDTGPVVSGRAMSAAPLVGVLLALVVAVPAWLAAEIGLAPLPLAAACVALLAVLTRGLHLDGLADTTDALGSGRARDGALAVLREPQVGAFGVVALVLAIVLQVTALATAWSHDRGVAALVVALVVSRAALPLLCAAGVPAARAGGLGAGVVGTVHPVAVVVVLTLTSAAVTTVGWVADGPTFAAQALLAAVVAWAAAAALAVRCVRRFGGVTGDVLGAGVEVAATVALLVLAVG